MRVTKEKNFWPYQVRRLLDSGHFTVDELARVLHKTPERIRLYVKGRAIPEAAAQRELLRILSTYTLRDSDRPQNAPPRMVTASHRPASVREAERGVYVEEIAPPGEAWYKIVTASGKVGIVHLPDELDDDGLYDNLCRRLDKKDPIQTLRAI